MKLTLKGKSLSSKVSMISAGAGLISFIAFCIYGAVYNKYFDLAVAGFVALGAVCSFIYATVEVKATELLNVVAVFLTTFALGLMAQNAYPVFADWYGNFSMYGSSGGIAPVIILVVLFVITIVLGLISCFTKREVSNDEA